jgi:hypothetical protein
LPLGFRVVSRLAGAGMIVFLAASIADEALG